MRFDELMCVCAEMSSEQTNDGRNVVISSTELGYISISWEVEEVFRISYRFANRCDKQFVFVTDIDEFVEFNNPHLRSSSEMWIDIFENELVLRSEYYHRFIVGDFVNTSDLDEWIDNIYPLSFKPTFRSQIKGSDWYQISAVADIADINNWCVSTMPPNVSLHFFNKWVNVIALAPNTVVTRMLQTEFESWDNWSFTINSLPILRMEEILQSTDNEPSIVVKADSEFITLECQRTNGTVVSITTKAIPGLIHYPQFHNTVDCHQIKVSADKILRCLETLTPQHTISTTDILRENVEIQLINSDRRLFLSSPSGELGLILKDQTIDSDSEIMLEANHLQEVISTIREDFLYLTMPQKAGEPLLLGDNKGIQYTIFGYQHEDLDLDDDIIIDKSKGKLDVLKLSEKMLLGVSRKNLRKLYLDIKTKADNHYHAKSLTLMMATLTSYGYLKDNLDAMGANCHEKIKDIFEEQIAQSWDDLHEVYVLDPYKLSVVDLRGSLEQIYTEYSSFDDEYDFCLKSFRGISILLARLDYTINATKPSFSLEIKYLPH